MGLVGELDERTTLFQAWENVGDFDGQTFWYSALDDAHGVCSCRYGALETLQKRWERFINVDKRESKHEAELKGKNIYTVASVPIVRSSRTWSILSRKRMASFGPALMWPDFLSPASVV